MTMKSQKDMVTEFMKILGLAHMCAVEEFKKKDGTGKIMAIAKFTEGINLFLKNAD